MRRAVLAVLALASTPCVARAAPEEDLRARTLDRLRVALADPDRGVRHAAVVALAKAGEPPESLATALADSEWCVRQEAAWWLRKSGPSALPTIVATLEKGTPGARASAAWALSGFGADAVPVLRAALYDGEVSVRLEALAAVRRLGGETAKALAPEVLASVGASSLEERHEAALALVDLRPSDAEPAVAALAEDFGDEEERVRALLRSGKAGERVAESLAVEDREKDRLRRMRLELGLDTEPPPEKRDESPPADSEEPADETAPPDPPPSAPKDEPPAPAPPTVEELRRALADGAVFARIRAARSLGERRVDAAVFAPALRDPERDVRVAAVIALRRATGDAVPALLDALKDPAFGVRLAAIRGLGLLRVGAAAVAPFLTDLSFALSVEAREALSRCGAAAAVPTAQQVATGHYGALHHAVEIFDAIGADGAGAVPHLAPLLDHADVNVRETAARCLRAIGPAARDAAPALIARLADARLCVVSHAALALGRTGVSEPLVAALDDKRARVRAYAAFAIGWALGEERGVDQVPFEVRLPVLDAGVADVPAQVVEALGRLEGRPREDQIRVLRAAIWSKDPAVGVRAASLLKETEMDAREAERAVELLLPEGVRRGSPVDFEVFRSFIGSSELIACAQHVARARATEPHRKHVFGAFHRIARADHIPAILWLDRVEESSAGDADHSLWMPFGRSDAFMRDRAKWLHGKDPGPEPAAVLRFFLERVVSHPEDGGLGEPLRHLLNDFEPEAADGPLLVRVAKALEGMEHADDCEYGLSAAVRAMGRLTDAQTLSYLRNAVASDQELVSLVAKTALARRGDVAARKELLESSKSHRAALFMLFDVDPLIANETIVSRLYDSELAEFTLDALERWGQRTAELGVRLPDEAFLGVEAALAAKPPTPRVLARAATIVPCCATRRLAHAVFEAFERPTSVPSLDREDESAWDSDQLDRATAFLYAADVDRTLRLLRRWTTAKAEPTARWVVDALLRLLDRPSAALVVAALERLGPNDLDVEKIERFGGPEVVVYLRRTTAEPEIDSELRDWMLGALARLTGWSDEDSRLIGDFREIDRDPVRAAIRAGDVEAVRKAHRALDPAKIPAREAVEPEPVWKQLGAAALRGDAAARADFWSAQRAARYRWLHYQTDPEMHTLGCDPATLPHWAADLDSNCCRVSDGLANDVFEKPFDMPKLYNMFESGVGQTASEVVRAWFRWSVGRAVWSPLRERFIAQPE